MKVAAKVPAAYHGAALCDYLAGRFTYLGKTEWQELIAEGKVTCAGERCDGERLVRQGEEIACELPAHEPPQVNYAYRIVYEDEWLLAVDKPPGLRVHSGGKFVHANLIYHLRHLRQPPYPAVDLVNRLDADTSGLVLLAKEKAVLNALMAQFRAGTVVKRYLAVVTGRPAPDDGTIDLPLGPVENALVPRFAVDRAQGKAAVSHYRTLRPLGSAYTLLALTPETGRTHQLRVHLAAIGHPLLGDALYTMSDADYLAHRLQPPPSEILSRQALHSHQLQFLHPVEKKILTLTAPLAADIEGFIASLSPGFSASTDEQDYLATDQI
jgi:RluA family pseudouridine synthase